MLLTSSQYIGRYIPQLLTQIAAVPLSLKFNKPRAHSQFPIYYAHVKYNFASKKKEVKRINKNTNNTFKYIAEKN